MAAPHVAGAVALIKSLHPRAAANPFNVDAFLKNEGTKVPAADNPRVCDAAGRGYFDDRYPLQGRRVLVRTDAVKEPLLYMGGIR
jgi:subtilisin family serine protease